MERGLGTKPRKMTRDELVASIEKLIADYDAAFHAWYNARRTPSKEHGDE